MSFISELNQSTYKNVSQFKYYCQKVLPLAYDDSLSYYELLCKFVNYLNDTIENVSLMGGDITSVIDTFEMLTEYVNNYFKNIDVQREINNKLDVMSVDGTLSKLLDNLLVAYKHTIDVEIGKHTADIKALENRMNGFTTLPNGSTTGDAELADIRVDAFGKRNTNAGTSIRNMDRTLLKMFDKTFNGIGMYSINLADLPTEHANAYIDNDGKIVTGINESFCIKRFTPPPNALFLTYSYGNGQTFLGSLFSNETNEFTYGLLDKNDGVTITGRYALLNYYDVAGGEDYNPKHLTLYTFDYYRVFKDYAVNVDTLDMTDSFISANSIQKLVNCDIHKIPIKKGYEYYATTINEQFWYGGQFNANNEYVGSLTIDANGKFNINPSTAYIKANISINTKGQIYSVYCKRVDEYADGTNDTDLYTVLEKPFDFNGKRVVAFGDSITYGVTSPNLARITDSYIKLFCDKAGAILTNKSVSGSTITNYSVSAGVTPICETVNIETGEYDIVMVAGGTNDYGTGRPLGTYGTTDNTTFYGALEQICTDLERKYPNADVIFITPINRTKADSKSINSLNSYRKAIQEVALSHNFNVIDGSVLGLPNSPSTYADKLIGNNDGCHPTALGHKIYAKGLCNVLL